MASKFQPFKRSDNWYRSPLDMWERLTIKQWQHMLLEYEDEFSANGRLYVHKAKKVGPGIYELRAVEKHVFGIANKEKD